MPKISLFFDSSALFAGIVSAKGAARVLLLLAESGHITITISEQVVTETERAIARKAPQALGALRQAILVSNAQIVHDPRPQEVKANQHLISHPADIPIVLAAMHARVDYLVTLNHKHFIEEPGVAAQANLQVGTPGDALQWVRKQLPAEDNE